MHQLAGCRAELQATTPAVVGWLPADMDAGAGGESLDEDASRQAHCRRVRHEGEGEVSWFQENPAPSLGSIARAGAIRTSAIIDIGGGASRLVDILLSRRAGI